MSNKKIYNVHLKAKKELASSTLDLSVKQKGKVMPFSRRIKQDLRDGIILTNSKHELYKMYPNDSMKWQKLPAPTKIAPGTTNLSSVFHGCSKLTEIDLSYWDTSSVTRMNGTFGGLQYLEEIDIEGLDTSNITSMANLFSTIGRRSEGVNIIGIEDLNVSQVTQMQNLFSGANVKELNLSKWNVSNVTDMGLMFRGSSIEKLDITGWDTSKATGMGWMFYECNSLKEVIGVLDLTSATTYDLTHDKKLPSLEKPIQLKNVPRDFKNTGQFEILSYR